jgi:hypothetical protein
MADASYFLGIDLAISQKLNKPSEIYYLQVLTFNKMSM